MIKRLFVKTIAIVTVIVGTGVGIIASPPVAIPVTSLVLLIGDSHGAGATGTSYDRGK